MPENDTESETEALIAQAREGDQSALAMLFNTYRPRLRRMVDLRMDRRLRGRIDASDVVQETYIRLAQKLESFGKNEELSFFLWLRLNAGHCLIDLHRKHLNAGKRDAKLEVSIYRGPMPVTDSFSIAAQLLGKHTTASQQLVRAEAKLELEGAINDLNPLDREILVLRHFEELSNQEVSQVLEIDASAASTRYFRALGRLKKVLTAADDK